MRKRMLSLLLMLALGILFTAPTLAQDGQDLKFPIGEDARFHWDDLKPFMDMDLSGQEVTVFGPWLEIGRAHV